MTLNNHYFHGTTTHNQVEILRTGFELSENYGRFGRGIYLTDSLDAARSFGESILEVKVDTSQCLRLHYLEIPPLFGETIPTDEEELLSFLEEAEGFPQLASWVLTQGYTGCFIEYGEEDFELVIYDLTCLQVISPVKTEINTPRFLNDFPWMQFDLNEEELIHIGTLNPNDKGRFSYEGHGLSVSTCPDEWERIARLGGNPWHTLTKPSHYFLDFHALTFDQRQQIIDWGVENDYVCLGEAYEVLQYDEDGEEYKILCETYEEALAEVVDEEDDACLPVRCEVLKATSKLEDRLQMDPSLGLAFDLLTPLFVEEVLDWDGVFWDDDYGYWSAPRAVIVPKALPTWTIR